MKKNLSIVLALVMALSLCSTALAKDQSRINIFVESEADIVGFFYSEEYESEKFYSFIIGNNVRLMMLCPKCQSNSYRGYTEHREIEIHPRTCPDQTDMGGDVCDEYDVYTWSFCDSCGYKTSEVFLNRYWIVDCHQEMPGEGLGWTRYIARPGQSVYDGYDFHEDPIQMRLSDCLP